MPAKCCKSAHAEGFAAGQKAGRTAGLAAAHDLIVEVAEVLSTEAGAGELDADVTAKTVLSLMTLASTIRELATKEDQ